MAEKKDTPLFKVNDVVKFTTAMNKGRQQGEGKVGGHYVEIKKYGNYEIVNDATINNVNTDNNLSTKELSIRPRNPNPRSIKGELISVTKEAKEERIFFTYTVKNEHGTQSLTITKELPHEIGKEVTIYRNKKRINNRNNQGGNRSNSNNQRNNRSRSNNNNNNNRQPQQHKSNNFKGGNRDNNRDGNRRTQSTNQRDN